MSRTIDEIVRESAEIWNEAQQMQPSEAFVKLSKMHADFANTYPAIISAMVNGTYSRDAVRSYLEYVAEHQWKNEDEYIDTQAKYLEFLWLANGLGPTKARAKYEEALEELRKDALVMRGRNERAKKIADERIEARRRDKARALSAILARDGAIIARDEMRPIIVTFDD